MLRTFLRYARFLYLPFDPEHKNTDFTIFWFIKVILIWSRSGLLMSLSPADERKDFRSSAEIESKINLNLITNDFHAGDILRDNRGRGGWEHLFHQPSAERKKASIFPSQMLVLMGSEWTLTGAGGKTFHHTQR